MLLHDEIFARMAIHDLPAATRQTARDRIAGGPNYDAHIAEIARAAGATVASPTTGGISFRRCATACGWKQST